LKLFNIIKTRLSCYYYKHL